MATNLAPVYLDDARVQLQGDPRPKVAKIVAAGGKVVGDDVEVVRLRDPADEQGTPLALEDVIDRAGQAGPVYLRCRTSPATDAAGLAADESSGLGAGTVTGQEFGGTGHGDRFDPTSSIGNRVRPQRPTAAGMAFGAARPGMAGQGAKGSRGDVPPDKRAKSDFPPQEAGALAGETSGAGDLQPGGRTGLGARPPRPARGDPDATQEFQSGGRNAEGLEASYTDEGVGSTGRRQAGRRSASGSNAPEQGAQGGAIRDASTDHAGRQGGQSGDEAAPAD